MLKGGTMKQIQIPFSEIIEHTYEYVLKLLLSPGFELAGFDVNKPIKQYQDFESMNFVFEQEVS